MTQPSIVQRAAGEFRQGNYLRALDLYRRLAEQIGEKNFRANILMCVKHLHDQTGRSDSVELSLEATKVACVMDEFTFHCYQPECNLWPLSPETAIDELETFRPDLLFIESAWHGKDDLWFRKISTLSQELKSVLQWCRAHRVPTVFWNKEDPVHFETFLTTAREFDFVFTTDIDCIARYKAALGHEHIYLLPFACQPKMHNPIEKYQRKDAFGFAGAYYVRYPERSRDLENYVEQFPKYKPLEIFDRNFGKQDPNYQFPEQYRKFIVGTLPFNEIDKAYKGYRYSINLNSIKQSQTMFARRVYELLGSNTLTVSNFSRGVRLFFGDLVISSDNGSEIIERLQRMDAVAEQKHRLAALRKVMREHTYRHRLIWVVNKALGRSLKDELPGMTMLALVESEQQYQWALDNYQAQRHVHKKLVLVFRQDLMPELSLSQAADASITILAQDEAATRSIGEIIGENAWLVLMAAVDYYGPNYLLDLALATRYTDARLIGKAARYKYDGGKTDQVAADGAAYQHADHLPRRASAIRADALPQGLTVLACLQGGLTQAWQLPGLAIDSFNYCENGKQAETISSIMQYVDDVAVDVGNSVDDFMREAEYIAPVEFDAMELLQWDALKLAQLFGDVKREKIKIELEIDAGVLHVKSQLADTQHEYIYIRNELPINVLPFRDNINNYLDVTPGLSVQYIFIFYNEKKEKINHVIHTANCNQTASVPAEASFFRMGWRIYGNGNAYIKSLLWRHRKLEPAKLLGRSDTLILTNHYPSYEDLYRNGFVHSRVKSYAERGVRVDVFRLRQDAAVSYQEFENVEVITGGANALRLLLDGGRYKRVLIHFLSPLMWETLQNYPELQKLVWVHGADIQPWYRRSFNYSTEKEKSQAARESDIRLSFWRTVVDPIPSKLKLIFVSKYLAEEVFEDLGLQLPKKSYTVVHNPIDTNFFEYIKKSPELRKFILSIRPYASPTYANDISVKVVLKLSEKPFFKDLNFTFIGDGKLFDVTLEPLRGFENVKIERRFLSRDEIAKYHRSNGIFLVPTRMDTQGVSRDEAMSSGLVPISNAVAAVPEFVDEHCGILAGAEDVDGLVDGITRIYNDAGLFTEMSRLAAQKVRELSAQKDVVIKELELFN